MDETNKSSGDGGGADSGLDATKHIDRVVIGRAVRERWPIPMAKRTKIAEELCRVASGEDEKADSRAVTSAARTLARMDALNQADEHTDRHYHRIDEGKPTELVGFEGVEVVVPGLPRFNGNGSN